MYPRVVTKEPRAVQQEVEAARGAMFPDGDSAFVPKVFGWAGDYFTGNYKDFQAVDTPYHDFEHTLQGTLCLVRLLHGRSRAGVQPLLTERMFQIGLLAILLHDTGYLRRAGDTEGTGAKYTVSHVERGAQFAAELLGEKGYHAADIALVQKLIRCTGIEAAPHSIQFGADLEKMVGCAIGTADLLGQMAADDYVEKLPLLYAEFAEARDHASDTTHIARNYSSANDLMKKTPEFWEKYVWLKLERDFGGVYRFLNNPYPDGPNEYLQRIHANMERLRQARSA